MFLLRATALLVLALGGLLALGQVPFDRGLTVLEGWIRDQGAWGVLAFTLVYIAAVLVMVPATPLTLAAGALFGPVGGTLVASVASTVGAALAFLIARHAAREALRQRIGANPRFAAIDRAIAQRGWVIVALLRLSPAVPFNLQNYLYGLTAIRFRDCLLTTWLAMLPGTIVYVALGHAGRIGLAAASGREGAPRTPGEWILLAAGLVATVAVLAVTARLARRALAEQALAGTEPGS